MKTNRKQLTAVVVQMLQILAVKNRLRLKLNSAEMFMQLQMNGLNSSSQKHSLIKNVKLIKDHSVHEGYSKTIQHMKNVQPQKPCNIFEP